MVTVVAEIHPRLELVYICSSVHLQNDLSLVGPKMLSMFREIYYTLNSDSQKTG